MEDPTFQPVIQAVGILQWNEILKPIYVSLCGAILGQRIRYTEARKLRKHVFENLGANYSHIEMTQWIDNMAAIGNFRVSEKCKLPQDRIEIIRRMNEYLRGQSPDYLEKNENVWQLKCISGIGEWTIETALLSSGRDWDIFPTGDLFLQKRLQILYGLTKKPNAEEVKAIVEKWKPNRGVYAWYLWRWNP